MIRGLAVGLILGVLLTLGGIYFYFASGMAPVAVADPNMPFERQLAHKSLDAHIDKAAIPPPPVQADEMNLLAGAKIYKDQCAGCHGLPSQPNPPFALTIYPNAPMLFKGKGVTDDPPGESFWKVQNGIRLTAMPSFKDALSNTEMWQVAQLVANADKVSDAVKAVLGAGAVAPAPSAALHDDAPNSQ